jgi:hypothetical protein
LDPERGIRIIAQSVVRNGKFEPYTIRTAFRTFSGSLKDDLKNKIRREEEGCYIRSEARWAIILADHDPQ